MIVVTNEEPGIAPVAAILDDQSRQVALWVGWNQDFRDLDRWLFLCGYVRVSFEPCDVTDHTKTFKLVAK